MAQDALELLTRRAGHELRVALLLKQFERIGDQRDLVRPVPIDRCLADPGAPRSGLDGERAIVNVSYL
jgi:hypothetical protein